LSCQFKIAGRQKSNEGGEAARKRLVQRSLALARSPEGEKPFGRRPQAAKSPRAAGANALEELGQGVN